jgi:aerobic-type carbon monoxide dehydrogenase small subunit (CoxS/CutS family)
MASVTLTVNGRTKTVEIEDRRLLADVLRNDFGCYGVHFGCSHGACGCCTIHCDGTPRLSCLTFAAQCDGATITTIEGISKDAVGQTLQQAFIDQHGLQCGFCTPGFIMALRPFVEAAEEPTEEDIREAMSGNICRCTGYHGIVEAVRAAIRTLAQGRASS